MATQEECRTAILREWGKRKPEGRRSIYGERWEFFAWIKENRPGLLSFRSPDHWQYVNGWLMKDER